ncbi:MAG: hypothetical protein RL095_236 [Verrucomicrobiota bacterium]|jgi:predicted thioredoxin/glutaredoxin
MSYSITGDYTELSIRESDYFEILNSIKLYAEKTNQLDCEWHQRILRARSAGVISLAYWNQSKSYLYTDLVDIVEKHLAGNYDEEINILKKSPLYTTSSSDQ